MILHIWTFSQDWFIELNSFVLHWDISSDHQYKAMEISNNKSKETWVSSPIRLPERKYFFYSYLPTSAFLILSLDPRNILIKKSNAPMFLILYVTRWVACGIKLYQKGSMGNYYNTGTTRQMDRVAASKIIIKRPFQYLTGMLKIYKWKIEDLFSLEGHNSSR